MILKGASVKLHKKYHANKEDSEIHSHYIMMRFKYPEETLIFF